MNDINEMTILEKVRLLKSLLEKADNSPEYSITVDWKENPTSSKQEARILIDNATVLFSENRIESLDNDVRGEAITNYHNKLNTYLRMFPEYNQEDEMTVTQVQKHM